MNEERSMYPKPWILQVEMTEGCNRRCFFCGIHTLYKDKERKSLYKYMSLPDAWSISGSLGSWLAKPRIEFALQGEPMLNPDCVGIINAFRTELPKSQLLITTNCDPVRSKDGFNGKKIGKMFRAGLNIFVADYYGEKTDMSYDDFCTGLKNAAAESGIPGLADRTFDFYAESNPEHAKIWGYQGHDISKIVIIDNTANRNVNRTLNNQSGNTDPDQIIKNVGLDEYNKMVDGLPKMKRCEQPFRSLSIKYDGAVPICCMDWGREHIMGKFPEDGSFEDIWNSQHYKNVRTLIFHKRRDAMSPCLRCDYHGYRVGLVENPDPSFVPDVTNIKRLGHEVGKYQFKRMHKYANANKIPVYSSR